MKRREEASCVGRLCTGFTSQFLVVLTSDVTQYYMTLHDLLLTVENCATFFEAALTISLCLLAEPKSLYESTLNLDKNVLLLVLKFLIFTTGISTECRCGTFVFLQNHVIVTGAL